MKRTLTKFFYGLSFINMTLVLLIILLGNMTYQVSFLFMVLASPIIPLTLATIFHVQTVNHHERFQISRKYMMLVFILYLLVLFSLLFNNKDRVMVWSSMADYFDMIRYRFNILPFYNLFKEFLFGVRSIFFRNLFGNIILFIPIGFLLPILSKKMRHFKTLIITMTVVMIIVELVQYFSLLGVGDIDDVILNVLGVAMGYGLWVLPYVQDLMKRYYVLEIS